MVLMQFSRLRLPSKHPSRVLVFFILAAISAFALTCYWPALAGPFVLDDEPNFYGLNFVDSFSGALAYSYSGPAGIRWISFLSFTLPFEIAGWKNDDAFTFKLINLIIHIVNTALVFAFLRRLFSIRSSPFPAPALWAAGIAIIWFIHPVHVNTVLYSVQRMTLLGATAVLAGLLFHLSFTGSRKERPTTHTDWLIYTAILWLITLIGILCKESAILLPLYVLACYSFTPSPFSRLQTACSLLAPYAALLVLLLATDQLRFGGRDFSMLERLLSQVLILKEYVAKIVLPVFDSFSLYYDDFRPVRSVSETRFWLSALFWLAFIGLAWLGKQRMPGLWLGCLWFLAGHALESTIIPLELYFDHRNYLPSLGIMIMLASALYHSLEASNRKIITLLLATLAIALAARYLHSMKQETAYWHNNGALAESLLTKHPDSLRATQHYTEELANQGRLSEAITMIDYIFRKFGVHASTAIYQVGLACIAHPEIPAKHDALIEDLKTLPSDQSVGNAMQFLLELTQNRRCSSIDWSVYEKYTFSLLSNKAQAQHYHNLVFLLVSSHMYRNNMEAALQSSFLLDKSWHTPNFVFLQMHLALTTNNLAAAELIHAEIQGFDQANQILYKNDIREIDLALKQLRHANRN